jgi:hypothetical protein
MWMNDECYALLLEAADKVQEVIDKLLASEKDGVGQPVFDAGMLTAAQNLLENEIPDEYAPLAQHRTARCERRLLQAILNKEM